jgi:DGQHR domain-containing protein
VVNFLETYGSTLSIEHSLYGGNLNLGVIRGFAPLHVLADISAADVYDQVTNPLGTQRDLMNTHAKEATAYALEAVDLEPAADPRSFPEIILNARDRNVVSITTVEDIEIPVDSIDGPPEKTQVVRIDINSRSLDWPKRSINPQISRLDGNHRLSQITDLEDREPDAQFPLVPFALFIGLTADQERALFRDINANQRKMETAHLDSIRVRLNRDELLFSQRGRALWLANELSQTGEVFAGKVFAGGSKAGIKKDQGYVPPIKISTLSGAILTTIKEASKLEALAFPPEMVAAAVLANDPSSKEQKKLEESAQLVKLLLGNYWAGVRDAFPEAWQDRNKYILLQAIGLAAFSQFGARVIEEQIELKAFDTADFQVALKQVAQSVTLEKASYEGIAGLSGAKVVFQRLIGAKDSDKAAFEEMKAKVGLGASTSALDGD